MSWHIRKRSCIIYFMNKLKKKRKAQVVSALDESNSIGATVRMTGGKAPHPALSPPGTRVF